MPENVPPTPEPAPAGVEIGVDRWVAQADERRERRGGISGRIAHLWELLPPAGKLAFLTPAIIVPFLPFVSEGNLFNYGIFILIYALLGLGLNVVVGFAGLLDLGYVAFFGFGAYIYAFLSGTHSEKGHVFTHHWSAQYSILFAMVICALLGLFLGSASRRLLGDYLAIVTLFFGQAFVVFTNAADPYGLTNGSNGLANIDPLRFTLFGYDLTISTTRAYYWFLLGCVMVVLIVLWCISESRTGRAWKASREDPLAAEMMGTPVNRLKIMAFSFGAAIAGLAGSVFAAAQTGAFPQNFSTQVLILIYAVVILGGTGSLTGMVVGAIAIIASNQVLDSTSPPNNARVLFYVALILGVVLTLKPSWKRIAVALGGTAVFGLAVHAIVDAVWSRGTSGQVTSGGFLTGVIRHFVLLPTNPGRLAVYGYLLMIVLVIVLVQLKGWWRVILYVPTLYLTALVWENLLIQNPAVTRYVLFGALLIAVMTIRPQGLFGTAKVEIV
jgi:branched-chain amino acid transport system permease protein